MLSDALERKDAAEADVDLVMPELLDCSREALGDLTLAVERIRPRRVHRADCGKDASEHGQQCGSHAPDLLCAVLAAQSVGRGQPLGG
jgi:hypothetical protein